ncbi:MAG: DUF4041 domain-containing protein [Candidatus Limiplasma sp.]|nr:DUF4041 domain-containing protein [Candidatus Limiplasma sp.]
MKLNDIFHINDYKSTIEQLNATQRRLSHELDTTKAKNNETVERLTHTQESLEEALDDTRAEIRALRSVMVDDHGKALDIIALIQRLEQSRTTVENEIASNRRFLAKVQEEIAEKSEQVKSLKCDIIELEEIKLLQDFGLYKPMYDFASSSDYKERLEVIRQQQKQMIKDKTAATCPTQWTVNNSIAEGRKMTNHIIKQVLLSFNIECENVVDRVTFSNFDSMQQRIVRAFDKLNILNEVNHISISSDYLTLKVQELSLAYEYQQKKQEEKEEARMQREILRENRKVAEEIEAERKRIEKEQAHYNNALARLVEQMQNEQDEIRRTFLSEKIEEARGNLSDLQIALQEVDYREANERAGYVYIISNIGAFGENIYKIGMTRRLDPQDRIDELGGASVPFAFDVHAFIFSSDAPRLEAALHNAFSKRKVNAMNNRKEFFNVTLEEIEEVVRENHDKTVEFNHIPIAEQYRESRKLWENTDAAF